MARPILLALRVFSRSTELIKAVGSICGRSQATVRDVAAFLRTRHARWKQAMPPRSRDYSRNTAFQYQHTNTIQRSILQLTKSVRSQKTTQISTQWHPKSMQSRISPKLLPISLEYHYKPSQIKCETIFQHKSGDLFSGCSSKGSASRIHASKKYADPCISRRAGYYLYS